MTDQPQSTGIVGSITDVAKAAVGALPPAFLMLVILNIVFIGLVMWFLDSQIATRTHLVERIVETCLTTATHQGR
jgi:hypothetical protein